MMKHKSLFLNAFLLLSTHLCCANTNPFVISIPKCGTHLAIKLGHKLTGKRPVWIRSGHLTNARTRAGNNLPWGHVLATQNDIQNLTDQPRAVVFITRDPRDEVVSMAYMTKKHRRMQYSNLPIPEIITKLIDDNNFLKKFVGFRKPDLEDIQTIADFYNAFLPWAEHEHVYWTTFERLVGSQGGGDDALQIEEIRNIAHHFGIEKTDEQLEAIADDLFGKSRTFRSGQIGSWREHFTQAHIEAFKRVAGDLLIALGYEDDLDW